MKMHLSTRYCFAFKQLDSDTCFNNRKRYSFRGRYF